MMAFPDPESSSRNLFLVNIRIKTSWEKEHTRRNDLSRENLNAQPPVIKMLYKDDSTRQSCDKIDLGMVEEVILLPLESCVWLLLNLEDNIPWLYAWCLIALASELDLVSCANASVDVNVKHLPLDSSFLAVATFTLVLLPDDLSLSITVRADSLEPLDHGTHLPHHGLHTVPITSGALLDRTLLSTTAITFGANDGFLESQLGNLATVDVLECNFMNVVNGAGLRRATLLHPTTEHAS